jgi:hypothetical protein
MTSIPPLDTVLRTANALREAGLVTALGGSGLLAALGLADQVRDWDLTTDATPEAVAAALAAVHLEPVLASAGEGRYATRARFHVAGDDHEVDLLVGFALRSGATVIPIRTRVTGSWRGLPLGDPAAWELAYRLMGRPEPAAHLRRWLDAQPDQERTPGNRA